MDIQRVNTLSSFLRGDAREWYDDEVERVPNSYGGTYDTLSEHPTFIQVICRLFRRFIHEASLTTVADRFQNVQYSSARGIKGVFSELTRFARCMPNPPDVYTFKRQLFIIPPPAMAKEMTRTVTAERSSVNDIMQAAIKCEKGNGAYQYYAKTRASRNPTVTNETPNPRKSYNNDKRNSPSNRRPRSRSPARIIGNRRYPLARSRSPPKKL